MYSNKKIYIHVMQPAGYLRPTEDVVGSKSELNYYRVMTEKYGKLFFDSENDYLEWRGQRRVVDDDRKRSLQRGRRRSVVDSHSAHARRQQPQQAVHVSQEETEAPQAADEAA